MDQEIREFSPEMGNLESRFIELLEKRLDSEENLAFGKYDGDVQKRIYIKDGVFIFNKSGHGSTFELRGEIADKKFRLEVGKDGYGTYFRMEMNPSDKPFSGKLEKCSTIYSGLFDEKRDPIKAMQIKEAEMDNEKNAWVLKEIETINQLLENVPSSMNQFKVAFAEDIRAILRRFLG